MPESLTTKSGEENVTENNGVEGQPSQYKINLDNAFAIPDSNRQNKDQQLVEANNTHDDRLIIQTEISNNVPMEVNVNQNFNNIDSALNLVKNVSKSENDNRNSEVRNINELNNSTTIASPNAMFLPPNYDPTFPEIGIKKEDNKVQVVSPSGYESKHLWLLPSKNKMMLMRTKY